MKRLISILLVVLLTVSLLPQVSIFSLAVETEGVYCNGTDYFVAEDGTEFFINSDDEDKLYQITPSGEVSLAVDEHTILLVNNGDTAYLVVFRNEECKLVRFDASSGNSSDIYTFPDAVCNIALRSNELLYTLDGAAYALNLATMGLSVLKESGINTIYFDENDDLAYVSSSTNDNSSPDVSNELPNSRGSNRGVTNYSPRLTAPATDNPYYTTLNVFHNSGYGMAPNIGNCTCYAFGRSYENLKYEPSLCHGNAGEWYAYNKQHGYYQYGKKPVLGAVTVWTSGGAGHVAVVEVINGDSVITSESGWQSFYFKTVTRSASNSNFSASSYYSFQGFIYVLGTSVVSGPPTYATVSTDYKSYAVDETVTFSISSDGVTDTLWIYCPNGETLYYQDVGATFQLAFGMSGHYQALVQAWNGEGSFCSDRIDFVVGPPTYATLSTDHTSYAVDETVTFSMDSDGNTNTLWIYCPNGDTLYYQDAGSSYQLGFGMSGHFQVLVQTWNGQGSYISDRIDFVIGPPTFATLSTDKSSYKAGETVTFPSSSDGSSNTLWIYYPDGSSKYYQEVDDQYALTFSSPGHYEAIIQAWNRVGSLISNRVSFSIECNHNYSTSITAPTCTAQGFTTYTCSICGDTYKGNYTTALGHNYTYAVSAAPTMAASGKLAGTCSRCSATTTVTLPRLNTIDYTYSVVQAATCTATGTGRYTWKTTDYGTFYFNVTIDKIAHNYESSVTAPTCTAQGYTTHTCTLCGSNYQDTFTEALGHAWNDGVVTQEPTETAEGIKTYTCLRCGATKDEPIPVISHVHHYTETVVAPTCTEQGFTLHTCTCGDSYKDNYTDALNHSFSAWTQSVAPTCMEKGEEKRTCSRCDAVETQEVSALGHNYNHVVTAPTCTEIGYTTHTCSRCDSSYVDTYVSALGHSFGDWVQSVAPTCTEKGEEKRTCSRCDAFETRELDAIGHGWDTPTYTWNADNSQVIASRSCKHNASHIESETVYSTSAISKPATCTQMGETTYTATFSNTAFSAQTKTVADVPLANHSQSDPVEENYSAATCTTTGSYDTVVYCSACGTEIMREHTTIPALGHDYHSVVTEPTCVDAGYTTYSCSRCGDTYTSGETAPIGHTWSEATYSWSEDNSKVTAVRVCYNNENHIETETVNTTSVLLNLNLAQIRM